MTSQPSSAGTHATGSVSRRRASSGCGSVSSSSRVISNTGRTLARGLPMTRGCAGAVGRVRVDRPRCLVVGHLGRGRSALANGHGADTPRGSVDPGSEPVPFRHEARRGRRPDRRGRHALPLQRAARERHRRRGPRLVLRERRATGWRCSPTHGRYVASLVPDDLDGADPDGAAATELARDWPTVAPDDPAVARRGAGAEHRLAARAGRRPRRTPARHRRGHDRPAGFLRNGWITLTIPRLETGVERRGHDGGRELRRAASSSSTPTRGRAARHRLHLHRGADLERRGEFLLFSDMPGDVRRRWSEADGVSEVMRPANKCNGMVYDAQGNLLVCEHVDVLARARAPGRRRARRSPRTSAARSSTARTTSSRARTARSTSATPGTGGCRCSASSASASSASRAST